MRDYQQKQKMHRQEGFTLVEVLIVIAIFSIGILGAMSMQGRALSTNNNTRNNTMAMEYAMDTMERLMQVGGQAPDNKFGVDDDLDGTVDEANESQLTDGIDNDDDGTTDEADEREWHTLAEFQEAMGYTRGTNIPVDPYYARVFNLTWDITDIDSDGDAPGDAGFRADAKRIDMTVTWDNGAKTMPFTSIRANML